MFIEKSKVSYWNFISLCLMIGDNLVVEIHRTVFSLAIAGVAIRIIRFIVVVIVIAWVVVVAVIVVEVVVVIIVVVATICIVAVVVVVG